MKPKLLLLTGLFSLASACSTVAPPIPTPKTPDATPAFVKNSSAQLLIGKWRHSSLVRIIDGETLAPQEITGENIADFFKDGTWSANSPQYRSSGTYRWLNDTEIEQTIVQSNLAFQLGLVSIKTVKVSDDRLELITTQNKEELEKLMPTPRAGVRRPNSVTVITVFKRVRDAVTP